jgi:hypothetical protein
MAQGPTIKRFLPGETMVLGIREWRDKRKPLNLGALKRFRGMTRTRRYLRTGHFFALYALEPFSLLLSLLLITNTAAEQHILEKLLFSDFVISRTIMV